MSGFSEYTRYDGVGLGELVRAGEVQASELVEAAIAAIEAVDPQLNAVVHRFFDRARQAAQAAAQAPLPKGPLAGVPVLAKDLLFLLEGLPMSAGSHAVHGFVAPRDSTLARRYRDAGMLILGRTNTPELGLSPVTEPALFGPTANPWDLGRSPGGSSGGSAAAVAARLVPIATGSDGGGSLRIPAAACGVFGFKPSRGRTPSGPERGDLWAGLAVEHVLTRSVRDSAAVLDLTAAPEPGAPYAAPTQTRPYLDEVTTAPGRLRIAFTAQPLVGSRVDADAAAAVESAARRLEELGHTVEEAAPDIDRAAFMRAYLSVVSVQIAAELDEVEAVVGRSVGHKVEPTTRAMQLFGRHLSAPEYEACVRHLHRVTRDIAGFFGERDVLLTPTLPGAAGVTGALQPTRSEHALLRAVHTLRAGSLLKHLRLIDLLAPRVFDLVGFTALFNATGQPAMSMPLHWNAAGLPVGVQFAARYGDEATLFRLAGQLEAACPWAQRRPPVCAS
ncbi:amidase [Haliangium ochraceum]|uniref:Amidase n=1 Tax=Haliangium ochraceum (strain DSM 14365 / JCM 11303 / SMP-2) TaxID=502025 RepID=D0LGI3_HALO1|nr:amidase [Haliangium ochraceum]ACY12729.1 Amidase [Haliangium ochraceum DSM 14365]